MTPVLTTAQAGRVLGITVSGVRWLVDTGRLRAQRAGRYRLIPVDEVLRMKRMRDGRAREQAHKQQTQR
jgi:excisionase family DNA binding protein